MIKNVIEADELAINKFKFIVAGMVPIFCLDVKGLKRELETATLPDQTAVTGGRPKVGSFTLRLPTHHFGENKALENWLKEGIDPVDPNYKKSATLLFLSKTNMKMKAFNIKGCFCSGMTPPDADLKDEGNEAETEWAFQYDDVKAV